ncbi:hypothetical protein [Flavobacterium degerlachei]|jgi:hypothetical protein|uniref:Por secretion system C-terminal sorting domain-containing protein n=1 Tax=Flavobacterium degerlachei TaxID=229203 RepID=A0A1H3E255_9FLAO|nr:hypothetical protein [Flavobacterium degerlachei]SDX72761.1 hypothetical protein SAMN05444338_11416 [Flavobacterium degerlachei]
MKKTAFLVILFFLSVQALVAQAPTWSVNENDYQYTMTFVAKLNVDGKQLIGNNDRVGAFVGSSCRGISGVTYVASESNYYAYLTVFSNSQGETVSFKLYDSSTDKTVSVSKQVTFEVNEHKGNLFQSFSIAAPSLNDKAEILTFNFQDIKSVSSVINGGKINISLYDSYALTELKPVFTLSKGAKLFKNKILQKSGEVTDNYTSSITYEVLSEDESSLSNYVVIVTPTTTPALFYKKDAVCDVNGVVKVTSTQEGASVVIATNGETLSTKQILNGEAIFPDLEIGTYVVTIGNEWKLINIILKEK